MNILNDWHIATAMNGTEIHVRIIPLKSRQNSMKGFKWVEVGRMIELQSGKKVEFNQDGKSFYAAYNQLYRLN